MPLRFGFAAVLVVIAGITTDAAAQTRQKKEGPVYLDAKDAGPDYALQGEYVADSGGHKLGAQVIADGNGKFTVVILGGGLPGEGFDGQTRLVSEGTREGDSVSFRNADA